MLLPDPAARITMEQIQSHPWFTTSLPAQVRPLMPAQAGTPLPHPWFTTSLPAQV